jgi:hypothetical protein
LGNPRDVQFKLGLGTCRDRMKLGKKIIWKMLNRDFKDLQEMQVNIEKIKMVKIAKKKKKALKEEKMKEKKKKREAMDVDPSNLAPVSQMDVD